MFGKKIGLRLHIFAAFCLVFVISFSTVFIAFRLVIQNYIDSDSKDKIKTTSENTLELAKELRFQSLFKTQTEKRSNIRNLIRIVSGNSDVGIAILDKDLYIDFPKTTDSYTERVRVSAILKALKKQEINLNSRNEVILYIDSSCYYTLLVPFNRDFFTEDTISPDSFFLFYLDSTPYRKFADSLDRTLYVVLISALLLSLVASLLVSNSIIRSLHKLTSFASRIGAGDFRSLNGHFMDKELDSLAGDMNLMAHRLSKADTEQKTFFQNASHELRTPLMSIQGYAEGIKYKVFDNPDEATEVIISESKRLSDMVENLLTLSRLDLIGSGAPATNKLPLDLRELVDSVIENTRGSAFLARKRISSTYPDQTVIVFGNDNDLFRALENLLANAIRHATNDVDLSIKHVDRYAVITITDDGEGIPDDLLPVIFNRFVRGEKGKHGIGLALVKAIVENHGGSISASNRKDGQRGAEFTLKLPIYSK
ncbi:MAG: HAMP domain-containing sensor histidine kinase [Oscillospiraceae bacterium]|nr:HAMP domain-containing sensor histidine kinase [Oscillospiraceae bacterium]